MIGDISKADAIYIACGFTDMRKNIDGLAAYVSQAFRLDPLSNAVFFFCGKKRDRLKALYWEGDGFVLLYKRLEGGGRFRWPGTPEEAKRLTWQQLRWLLEGLEIEQKTALKKADKKLFI
jgi:transposase